MKNRNLIYIANIRLPTEKAHGIQIMEMCGAFAEQGFKVELLVPRRFNPIQEDPFVYHDVKNNFTIRKLSCIDTTRYGRIGFLVELFTFAESAAWYALFKKDTLFYTRDELVAVYLKLLGKNVVWEAHTGQKNLAVKILISLGVRIVTITEALKELYVSLRVPSSNILVAPDGADLNRFDIPLEKNEARTKLGLPLSQRIVLYKGHLYEQKGAHVLAEAATHLPEDVLCVFIGGTEGDVTSFKERFGSQKNVLILGNRPRQETPLYQKAADLLVIPNSARDDVSKLYTSPMKLFGYMASGVPIIASDLPSLREIIGESTAYFFVPDDPRSLSSVILKAFGEYEKAKEKGAQAFILADNYSWQKRAGAIISFIS